ncbi:MAG: hypothetical protein AAGC63_15790, partial [Propionicimonas sp.]
MPARWLGVPVVGGVAWLVLVAATGAGVLLFQQDNRAGVVAVMLVGLWVHAVGWWLSAPSGRRATWYVLTSLAGAAGIAVTSVPAAGVVVVVAVAGAVVWGIRTKLLRAQVHKFAWAAAQLAKVTGDERELHRILTPARTASGLPAKWSLPSQSDKRMTLTAGDDVDEEEDAT